MSPDKNFRIKKSTKTMIALFAGTPQSRNEYRHAMIDAQLCEEAARRAALRARDNKDMKDNKGVKGMRSDKAYTASTAE